jgi:hypothetical protein
MLWVHALLNSSFLCSGHPKAVAYNTPRISKSPIPSYGHSVGGSRVGAGGGWLWARGWTWVWWVGRERFIYIELFLSLKVKHQNT